MSTRFLTDKDRDELIQTLANYSKEVDTKIAALRNTFGTKEEVNKIARDLSTHATLMNDKLASNYYNAKTIDNKFATQNNDVNTKISALSKQTDSKISESEKKFYSKNDIDTMFGSYAVELALLIGGVEL